MKFLYHIYKRDSALLSLAPFGFSLAGSILSAFIFSSQYSNSQIGEHFKVYFYILLSIITFLSIVLYILKIPISIRIFLFIRFFFILLACYPLESYLGINIILMTTLIIEISFYLNSPESLIIQGVFIFIFLVSRKHRSAWWMEIEPESAASTIAEVFIFLILGISSQLLKYQSIKETDYIQKTKHLNSVISQLSDANIGFQSYVKSLEIQVIMNERKRVSREIHDTVGYVLTNIIMMTEAAIRLPDKRKEKRNELLSLTRSQAQKGLVETRAALRQLRNEQPEHLKGIAIINELVTVFKKATGIDTQIEYGNFKDFTTDEINAIIFKLIQEGLTNAFRHGMASQIRIYFWDFGSRLQVIIHDNGIGVDKIVEGVGIAGMKERIYAMGGNLKVESVIDGFKITASIPCRKNEG